MSNLLHHHPQRRAQQKIVQKKSISISSSPALTLLPLIHTCGVVVRNSLPIHQKRCIFNTLMAYCQFFSRNDFTLLSTHTLPKMTQGGVCVVEKPVHPVFVFFRHDHAASVLVDYRRNGYFKNVFLFGVCARRTSNYVAADDEIETQNTQTYVSCCKCV